jgi:integrase
VSKKKLTPVGIASLRPRDERYEIADALSALRVLILPSGNKSFVLRYRRPDGRSAKLTLGAFDPSAEMQDEPVIGAPLTLGAARQLAAECLRHKERGRDPAALRQAAKAERAAEETLGDILPAYVAYLVANNRSWAPTERALRGLVKPWMDRPLKSVTPDDCWRLIGDARLRGMGLKIRRKEPSEARARLAHSLLGGLFSWCVRQRKIERSPMTGLEPPQAIVARDRVLGDAEIAIFWQATETLDPWHRGCLRLLLLTGARLNEIAKLRHDEIRGDAILLPGARVKNKRPHILPLSRAAREVLDAAPRVDGSPFVFSTGKRPIANWFRVKQALDAAMRELGWNGEAWRVHDLRRTAATLLARQGTPVHVCEKILNHASGSISGIAAVYNRHSYQIEMADALESLGETLRALVARSPLSPPGAPWTGNRRPANGLRHEPEIVLQGAPEPVL